MTEDQTSNDNSPDDSLILVHTTCADRDEAERLAGEMVENRLAACASVGQSIASIYPWEGKIERDTETPLTLKTTRARFGALREFLNERHSYDVPELLAVEVVDGNADYIQWVRDWVVRREDA
ncbi:MAG TPA: divalent-cation tolerance protein CutA [Wenzhouxiangellaceae bacterium]|nr:divalent-cation tolerance protein CutA [Wenzhouxiangellaceae bacterium]